MVEDELDTLRDFILTTVATTNAEWNTTRAEGAALDRMLAHQAAAHQEATAQPEQAVRGYTSAPTAAVVEDDESPFPGLLDVDLASAMPPARTTPTVSSTSTRKKRKATNVARGKKETQRKSKRSKRSTSASGASARERSHAAEADAPSVRRRIGGGEPVTSPRTRMGAQHFVSALTRDGAHTASKASFIESNPVAQSKIIADRAAFAKKNDRDEVKVTEMQRPYGTRDVDAATATPDSRVAPRRRPLASDETHRPAFSDVIGPSSPTPPTGSMYNSPFLPRRQ